MEDFTIKTRLTTKEYTRVMFLGLYKKPAFILTTLLGLYLVATVMLDYLMIIHYYIDTPLYEILLGTFLVLAPTLIVFISVRQFTSNPSFQNDMTYIFGDSGVAIQGLTFKCELL